MSERRYRDAVTGEYVTKAYADEHPDTTVSEVVDRPAPTPEPEPTQEEN